MNKKSVLIAGVCIAVLALAGFFGVLPYMEKRIEEDVAAFLRRFSADTAAPDVKADLLSDKVTIKGAKLSYEHFFGDILKGMFAADEIIVRGFDRNSLKGSGRKIADSVEISGLDMRAASPIAVEMEQKIRLKTLTLRDVSGDLARLAAPAAREPGIKGMVKQVDVLRTFHLGALSGTDYEADIEMAEGLGNVRFKADGFRLKDATLLKGSDFVCDNIKIWYMGMNMLSVDSLGFDFSSVPDYYTLLSDVEAASLEGVEPAVRKAKIMQGIAKMLEQAPLTVKGLKIVNLNCPPGQVKLREFLTDVHIAASSASLRVNFAGVSLPASVYTTLGGFMAGFARAHNNSPLNLDAGLDLEAFWKGQDGEIRLKKFFLEDKNLASVEVSGNLGMNGDESWLESIAGETGTDVLLKDMRATLTDSKLLDTVCMGLAMGAPDKAAAIRAQFASEMADKAGQEKDPDFRRILEGAAEFARAPGSLTVSVRLDKPVPLEKVNDTPSDTVLGLNATVEYSPAGNSGGSTNLP